MPSSPAPHGLLTLRGGGTHDGKRKKAKKAGQRETVRLEREKAREAVLKKEKRAKVRERQSLRKARRVDDAKKADALEQAMPTNVSASVAALDPSERAELLRYLRGLAPPVEEELSDEEGSDDATQAAKTVETPLGPLGLSDNELLGWVADSGSSIRDVLEKLRGQHKTRIQEATAALGADDDDDDEILSSMSSSANDKVKGSVGKVTGGRKKVLGAGKLGKDGKPKDVGRPGKDGGKGGKGKEVLDVGARRGDALKSQEFLVPDIKGEAEAQRQTGLNLKHVQAMVEAEDMSEGDEEMEARQLMQEQFDNSGLNKGAPLDDEDEMERHALPLRDALVALDSQDEEDEWGGGGKKQQKSGTRKQRREEIHWFNDIELEQRV